MVRYIPDNTPTFHYINMNPKQNSCGDCVVRALAFTLKVRKWVKPGTEWANVMSELHEIAVKKCRMPNDKIVFSKWLADNGWEKQKMPRRENGTRLTITEFCEEHPTGLFVVSIASHLTAVYDGVVYDTWDCGHKCVGNYWEEL